MTPADDPLIDLAFGGVFTTTALGLAAVQVAQNHLVRSYAEPVPCDVDSCRSRRRRDALQPRAGLAGAATRQVPAARLAARRLLAAAAEGLAALDTRDGGGALAIGS